MSNELGNRLSGYEAQPSEAVWDALNAALNTGTASPAARRLAAYEQQPPANIWEAIETRLEDGNYITGYAGRLYQYEQEPPSYIWESVQASMLSGTAPSYADRLLHYSPEPPAGVWEKIATQLTPATAAKVVPFYRRYARYISVAAVLTLVIFLTSLLISKKTISDGPATATSGLRQKAMEAPGFTEPATDKEPSHSPMIALITEADLEQADHKFATLKKLTAIRTQTIPGAVASLQDALPKVAEQPEEITSGTVADKYIIYSDDKGKAVKLPKKVFDAFACAANETDCKENLKCLQEKLSTSSFSTDFISVMDMISSLDGK